MGHFEKGKWIDDYEEKLNDLLSHTQSVWTIRDFEREALRVYGPGTNNYGRGWL